LNQARNGKTHQASVPAAQDSRRPGSASVAGGVIPVAVAGTDVPVPRRSGAAPGPISSASITTRSAVRPATPAAPRVAAPARPPAGDPAVKKRGSGASVVAAADHSAKGAQVTAPVPAAGLGNLAAPLEKSDIPIGPEDGQATD
ncbi:MAG: hypothetical protein ACRET3_02920, partial [Burkholderiales bacterium]